MNCEKLHRELWDWMAETGASWKGPWPGWARYHSDVWCFACLEAGWKGFSDGDLLVHCPKCPIDWGVEPDDSNVTCEIEGSHYENWLRKSFEMDELRFDDPQREVIREELMKLAAVIRDLPWNRKNSTR